MLRNEPRTLRTRFYALIRWLAQQRRAHFTLAAAKEAALWFVGAAFLFPSSLASLGSGVSPFAPAMFSAGLCAGLNPFSMLLGSLCAIPVGPFSPEALAPAMSCLCTWGTALCLQLLFSLGPADREGRDLRMSACAAVGALLPALVMARGVVYNLLSACASGAIAAALAPALCPALMLRRGRARLLPDEKLALFGALAVVMLGCTRLPGLLMRLPLLLALLSVLVFSGPGPACGALGGVCSGLALGLCGYDPLFCALLPLAGALAGALSPVSRPASALALLVGASLVGAWRFGIDQCLPEAACALIAGFVYSFLPESLVAPLYSSPSDRTEGDRHALARQRSDLKRKMDALADVFHDLSTGYTQAGSALPAESEMVSQLRAKLCSGCPSYAACWSEGSGAAGRLLCQLLSLSFSGALISEESELPPELGRQCRRAGQIPRRVGPLLADYDSRRRTELKRTRLAALMSAQFDQARALLQEAGEQIQNGAQSDPELASVAKAALEKAGVRAESLYAVGGDRPEICARLVRRPDDPHALSDAARLVSAEMDEPFSASLSRDLALRLSPLPRHRLQIGFCSVPGSADRPNGDSRIAQRLSDGRSLIALSDGMGSGERAGRESAETLRLISRFLQAGVEPCSAIDAINELMLLRSGEDMYSTVDLCLIDEEGSMAEFIKLGACRSYLLRGGACVRLESGRLPLGILEEVRPVRRSVPLCRGDLLVMATDGLECTDEDEWIAALLRDLSSDSPQHIAEALVHSALERPRAHADDTTVLAVRVA